MDRQNTLSGTKSTDGKVVSLFDAKKASDSASQVSTNAQDQKPTSELSFEEVMRRNAENHERLQKERLKANSSVLKSYRIKN